MIAIGRPSSSRASAWRLAAGGDDHGAVLARVAQLTVPLSLPRQRRIDRVRGLGEHGFQQLIGEAANRLRATVAVNRLRLAVPEPDPTLDRITHDHRVMGEIEKLAAQLHLLLGAVALGDVAR